ncbi:hypothetical protein TREMEDRAFT_31663, partial [Tremella mesenterica DSM 1558]|uniref:uncharacterized protein n=1 Tax=Tremella mesenterica (strain ATCC 24925 / CBS 8224 / DSM 1558 / NBRC 9311 / NRRL Y-6157 / RJB 2259-6 / UBC 559-6) TaxID=578456 RepID=UPI0003F49DB8
GPWFSTQLTLSLTIGLCSFLVFCFLRTKWDIVYMGRTKLKNFSPSQAHNPDLNNTAGSRFFGWILPTWKTSEFTVLQTVGLDAAVLLSFYKMAFSFFALSALLATAVLMPLNFFRHGTTDAEPDPATNTTDLLPFLPNSTFPVLQPNSTVPQKTLYDLILDPQTSALVNLIFTYLFTGLCLSFLHRNYHQFVVARQSFALHLIHSISSRTVLVTCVPSHLRGDRALADYFEGCGWLVESVSVCREVEAVRLVLEKRTNALLKLEQAWADWVGNPANATIKDYDPNVYTVAKGTPAESGPKHGTACVRLHTGRPRPTYRPRWFGTKVDAIEFWEREFQVADEEVKQLRRTGKFEATHAAFVTFENAKDAQTACQVVHYPHHTQVVTEPAPEPRDVVWSKVSMPTTEHHIRDVVIMALVTLLLLLWTIPVGSVATLLSYNEIKKVMPWLARLLDSSPRLAAIVQNSLPSLAIITFNGLLPFLLEWMSYLQGFVSRSATEYSLMKKYYLFLLVSVLFIFLLTTTYLALVRDLADTPMKIPEKLASALQGSNARNFMISYVMLQALGLMPLQLLNVGPLFSLGFARLSTKTPRDYAEANAPPMLNYGWVYPQALLIFTITLVYSVVSPLILVFGAMYFGVAYLVYKYKLLFIYFKPYESNGEAWRLTFARLLWALMIFQVFMTGLFSLRPPYYFSGAMVPLLAYTLWWSWTMYQSYGGLSEYVALSSICEVQRGEGADSVAGVAGEGSVTRSQSNLNHRRYAMNDETLYVAPSDKRTDYSQPPMTNFYYGVLNTGRRRYAHPALSGQLPTPWLPAKHRPEKFGDNAAKRRGVVLSLRRQLNKPGPSTLRPDTIPWTGTQGGERSIPGSSSSLGSNLNPWNDTRIESGKVKAKKSYDSVSGVIFLPNEDENVWANEEESEDEAEHGVPESPVCLFSQFIHLSSFSLLSLALFLHRSFTAAIFSSRRRCSATGWFAR